MRAYWKGIPTAPDPVPAHPVRITRRAILYDDLHEQSERIRRLANPRTYPRHAGWSSGRRMGPGTRRRAVEFTPGAEW
jgi:hypothetical protein